MSTKAEQFRYRDERDPKKKKKDEDRPHVTRSSRMSPRAAEDGTPLHDNARAGKKASVQKESGTRKSTRKTKKGRHKDNNLERKAVRKARSPQTRARKAKAKAKRPRGGGK